MSTVRISPDVPRALAVAALAAVTSGCSYPMLTHTVVPDSGFVFGAVGGPVVANDTKRETLPVSDVGVFLAGGTGGADDDGGALRISGVATLGSGLSADLYGKVPGRPLSTDFGVGVMGLFTQPRHGAIPYVMVGWPIGGSLLSIAEGVAFTSDSTKHGRVLVSTIAWQPPGRNREYVQAFLGFVVGRQEPGCYSSAIVRSSCWVPFAWFGTSVDFHFRPRDSWPRRR